MMLTVSRGMQGHLIQIMSRERRGDPPKTLSRALPSLRLAKSLMDNRVTLLPSMEIKKKAGAPRAAIGCKEA
jgi:hypothetical protein